MNNKTFQILIDTYEKKLTEANQLHKDLKQLAQSMGQQLNTQKSDLEKMTQLMSTYNFDNNSDIVKLNIGGKIFSTYRSTLNKRIKKPNNNNNNSNTEYYPPNLLQSLISGVSQIKLDESNAIFIDRDSQYFHYILNYLRYYDTQVKYRLPDNLKTLEQVKKECEFYKLNSLIDLINNNSNSNNIINSNNSNILNDKQLEEVLELCNLNTNNNFKLLYRASRDGFGAQDFHSKCDDYARTLTIIKTSDLHVFGGWTSASWASKGMWKTDETAFLFSYINKTNEKMIIKCTQPQYAIYCNAIYGPTFGGGHSIYISDESNTNTMSHSNLGLFFFFYIGNKLFQLIIIIISRFNI